ETEQLLHDARHNPHFAEMMRDRGYNEESWAYGETLLLQAKTAGNIMEKADAAKLGATNTYERKREQIWKHSRILAKTCETLFQGKTKWLGELGLHGKRKDGNGTSQISKPRKSAKFDTVVAWQRHLYEAAQTNTQIASILAANGFPGETLTQAASNVEALVQVHHRQEQAKATCMQRRRERDAAFKTLIQWLRCAQRAAELATEM
ncbi:MAG: hypothetical protein KDJ52_08990, partial [Anaerolineae bacterium]|nr:hypothetical protein [Anaerolineae bacterium]